MVCIHSVGGFFPLLVVYFPFFFLGGGGSSFWFSLTWWLWFDLHRHFFSTVLFFFSSSWLPYNQEMEMQKSTCCHSKYCPTPNSPFTYMLVCSLLPPRMPSFGFSPLHTNSPALSSRRLAFNLWPPFRFLLFAGIVSRLCSCQFSLSFPLRF